MPYCGAQRHLDNVPLYIVSAALRPLTLSTGTSPYERLRDHQRYDKETCGRHCHSGDAVPPKGQEPHSLRALTAEGTTTMVRASLAEILLASDAVTSAQLAQAEAVSTQRGVPLAEVLVQ